MATTPATIAQMEKIQTSDARVTSGWVPFMLRFIRHHYKTKLSQMAVTGVIIVVIE